MKITSNYTEFSETIPTFSVSDLKRAFVKGMPFSFYGSNAEGIAIATYKMGEWEFLASYISVEDLNKLRTKENHEKILKGISELPPNCDKVLVDLRKGTVLFDFTNKTEVEKFRPIPPSAESATSVLLFSPSENIFIKMYSPAGLHILIFAIQESGCMISSGPVTKEGFLLYLEIVNASIGGTVTKYLQDSIGEFLEYVKPLATTKMGDTNTSALKKGVNKRLLESEPKRSSIGYKSINLSEVSVSDVRSHRYIYIVNDMVKTFPEILYGEIINETLILYTDSLTPPKERLSELLKIPKFYIDFIKGDCQDVCS
jgi:hypothetical protein